MKKEDLYARMMHTPDDPARAELRAALREAWKQLLPLHRALIDAASAEYSADRRARSPARPISCSSSRKIRSSTGCKPLTSLIVDIDTMSRTDFERADVDAIVARLERLFGADRRPRLHGPLRPRAAARRRRRHRPCRHPADFRQAPEINAITHGSRLSYLYMQ